MSKEVSEYDINRSGGERFTESLAAFLEENYGQRVQPDSL